jgi:hypothetical protein
VRTAVAWRVSDEFGGYFYCSEWVGVTMPGFGNINRQCLQGVWWVWVCEGA